MDITRADYHSTEDFVRNARATSEEINGIIHTVSADFDTLVGHDFQGIQGAAALEADMSAKTKFDKVLFYAEEVFLAIEHHAAEQQDIQNHLTHVLLGAAS